MTKEEQAIQVLTILLRRFGAGSELERELLEASLQCLIDSFRGPTPIESNRESSSSTGRTCFCGDGSVKGQHFDRYCLLGDWDHLEFKGEKLYTSKGI